MRSRRLAASVVVLALLLTAGPRAAQQKAGGAGCDRACLTGIADA